MTQDILAFFNARKRSYKLSVEQRFNENYIPDPNSGCWHWIGAEDSRGYGQQQVNGKLTLAHRLSWMIRYGDIPSGLCVCHKCDTPLCVNPDHLFTGTKQDNTDDRVRKGRSTGVFGSKNNQAKLKEADIIKIREDKRIYVDIAKDYGVGKSTIGNVKTGKVWGHIK